MLVYNRPRHQRTSERKSVCSHFGKKDRSEKSGMVKHVSVVKLKWTVCYLNISDGYKLAIGKLKIFLIMNTAVNTANIN